MLSLGRRLLLPVALVAAGCGGGGAEPVTVEVTIDELSFAPATVEAPTGSEVTVDLVSRDFVRHTWVLLDAGPRVQTADEIDAARVVAEVDVPAEATRRVVFEAPSPGTYQVVCTVPGHLEEGMTATLVVTP